MPSDLLIEHLNAIVSIVLNVCLVEQIKENLKQVLNAGL